MIYKISSFFIKLLYGAAYTLVKKHNKYRAMLEGVGSYFSVIYNAEDEGFGETHSARYCYSIWLKHFSISLDNGLKGYPETVAELGPGASIGTGLAALIAGAKHYHALDLIDYSNKEQNLLLFDELVELFEKRVNTPDVIEFPAHFLTEEYLNRVLNQERIKDIKDSLMAEDGRYISLHILHHDKDIIEENSIDFVFSHAVMEHVINVSDYYENIHFWLKPEGVMSHQIDFDCHALAQKWNGHWAHSDFTWKVVKGLKENMINRFTHSDHINWMQQANFDILNATKYTDRTGIESEQLAPRFKNMSRDDLRTKGSLVQAMKN